MNPSDPNKPNVIETTTPTAPQQSTASTSPTEPRTPSQVTGTDAAVPNTPGTTGFVQPLGSPMGGTQPVTYTLGDDGNPRDLAGNVLPVTPPAGNAAQLATDGGNPAAAVQPNLGALTPSQQAAQNVAQPANVVVAQPPITAVPLWNIKTDNEDEKKFLEDSHNAVADAVEAVKAGVSKALDGVGNEIEPLSKDLIPAAAAFIESKTSPQVGNFIKALVGAGESVAAPLETLVDAKLLAGLRIFQADVEGFHI